MNVDEQHEGYNVLVETLRMHMDEGTKMQWSAREGSGERLTYQNLIEDLKLRHGLRRETHKETAMASFALEVRRQPEQDSLGHLFDPIRKPSTRVEHF